MRLHSVYNLKAGVQVREEKFGLLFYNYAGPRLYFVPTEDLIEDAFFDGKQQVGELVENIQSRRGWPRQWIESQIGRVLRMLEEKELVYGESVC